MSGTTIPRIQGNGGCHQWYADPLPMVTSTGTALECDYICDVWLPQDLTTITYTDGNELYDVTTAVTVSGTPVLSSASGTDPTTCSGSNGQISFSVTNVSDGTYTVTHSSGSFSASVVSGTATITGLSSGTYSNFSITNSSSCTGSSTLSVTLSDPTALRWNRLKVERRRLCSGLRFPVVAPVPASSYQWYEVLIAVVRSAITGATSSAMPYEFTIL